VAPGAITGVECDDKGMCHLVRSPKPKAPAGPTKNAAELTEVARKDLGVTSVHAPRSTHSTPSSAEAGTSNSSGAESQCDLKILDSVETGVVFVNDPKAESLFVDTPAWSRAKSQTTVMPSVPGR
jgi:hypothetical protein